jgi:hypothetical protein
MVVVIYNPGVWILARTVRRDSHIGDVLPAAAWRRFVATGVQSREKEMADTALITGITGQDGTYLAELLGGLGSNAYGLVRGQNNPRLPMVAQLCPAVELDRHWPKETAMGHRGGSPTGTRGRLAGSGARHGRRRLRTSCIVELLVYLGCASRFSLRVPDRQSVRRRWAGSVCATSAVLAMRYERLPRGLARC